jgi:hypothetical protein
MKITVFWDVTPYSLIERYLCFRETSASVTRAGKAVASSEILETLYKSKLTSWSRALLEKAPVVQVLKNLPAFYGTRRFITVFTRSLQ